MLRNIHKLYINNFKFWKKFRHLKEYINTCEYELKYINTKLYIDEVCIDASKYLYLSVFPSDRIPAASEGPWKAYVDPLCAGEKGRPLWAAAVPGPRSETCMPSVCVWRVAPPWGYAGGELGTGWASTSAGHPLRRQPGALNLAFSQKELEIEVTTWAHS